MESDYFVYRSISRGIQEIFITTAGKPDLTIEKQAETFYLKMRDDLLFEVEALAIKAA